MGSVRSVVRAEAALWGGAITVGLFFTVGQSWVDGPGGWTAVGIFAWLFAVMLWLSFGVVRHAECLAALLGEPLGTLILTLAVISIEVVMISAVMLTGQHNLTMARDTMFSVVMIVLNGMLGVTLLVGGLKHHQQSYNLDGAQSYLAVLTVLAFLGLILPRFTESAPGGAPSTLFAIFLIVGCVGLYGIFLILQSTRHRSFFSAALEQDGPTSVAEQDHGVGALHSVAFHVVFLLLTLLPIVLLSKKVAKTMEDGLGALNAPQALAGFLVAALVLSPEAMAAVKSALRNDLQRTVNISLGSALATIGLTIPAILVISLIQGHVIELGLEANDMVLLVATLITAAIVFSAGKTNMLAGAVHLVLFVAYVVLIFD